MICAISIGAAVTSQTRCPSSRCIWASARVPGQIRSAIASSKISSPSSCSSVTVCPAMNPSAEARASATWPGSSTPTTRKYACFQAAPAISRVVKNLRRCSPRAKWKMLAPCMTVLSTSKNAAATGSSGGVSADSTSAAAAAASPASTERSWRLRGRALLSRVGVTGAG